MIMINNNKNNNNSESTKVEDKSSVKSIQMT